MKCLLPPAEGHTPAGASYLVGTSWAPARLVKESLQYDKAINYSETNPFLIQEFRDEPFDLVVDLAGGLWL